MNTVGMIAAIVATLWFAIDYVLGTLANNALFTALLILVIGEFVLMVLGIVEDAHILFTREDDD